MDAVRLDEVYDLTVRFGSQSRTKCAGCRRYLSVRATSDEPGTGACICGIGYRMQNDGMFVVIKVPE